MEESLSVVVAAAAANDNDGCVAVCQTLTTLRRRCCVLRLGSTLNHQNSAVHSHVCIVSVTSLQIIFVSASIHRPLKLCSATCQLRFGQKQEGILPELFCGSSSV